MFLCPFFKLGTLQAPTDVFPIYQGRIMKRYIGVSEILFYVNKVFLVQKEKKITFSIWAGDSIT